MTPTRAWAILERRFSDRVRVLAHYEPYSEDLVEDVVAKIQEKLQLAKAALERAGNVQVVNARQPLGDIYRAVRRNLTDDESVQWDRINTDIDRLSDQIEKGAPWS